MTRQINMDKMKSRRSKDFRNNDFKNEDFNNKDINNFLIYWQIYLFTNYLVGGPEKGQLLANESHSVQV